MAKRGLRKQLKGECNVAKYNLNNITAQYDDRKINFSCRLVESLVKHGHVIIQPEVNYYKKNINTEKKNIVIFDR